MPSRTSRIKNSKAEALEILERQRRGEKVDIPVKEDEPLFDYVEGEGHDDYEDSNDEYIDDGYSDEESSDKRRSKSKPEVDPRQSKLTNFLQTKSKSIASTSANQAVTSIDEDAILDQMLFDVQPTIVETKKPLKKLPERKPEFDFSSKRRKVEDSPLVDVKVIDENTFDSASFDNIIFETKELKVETNCDETGMTYEKFYWYDCYEDESKFPGTIYLFGRILDSATNLFVSCCAIVRNLTRTIYIPIHNKTTYGDIENELKSIHFKKYKINNYKLQKVTKRYVFSNEANESLIHDYVQIDYLATNSVIPSNLVGQTFNKVLNATQGLVEKFLLDYNLKGPCWLRLYSPIKSTNPITWSKSEVSVDSMNHIKVDNPVEDEKKPYFSVLALSIKSYTNPITKIVEIVSIAVMFNKGFFLDECLKRTNKASGHFCILAKPPANRKDLRLPYDFNQASKKYNRTILKLVDSERDLLIEFMKKFQEIDPDIVVGHDLINFELETLVSRMKVLKVGDWSKLGRFKRTELPNTKSGVRNMFSGRVMCDTRISAMELIHSRSYDLTELCKQVLNQQRVEYDHEQLLSSFSSSQTLLGLIDSNWQDVDSVLSILVELNIIPLAYKITCIAGNILSRTLMGGRSERNEYLLLHAFHERNFICPEKVFNSKYSNKNQNAAIKEDDEDNDNQPIRKKAAYAGGLVLEPKVGFYDNYILLMDFNSLYPSIIQEFNICFSTVERPATSESESESMSMIPDEGIETGVLPTELKNLVDRRRQVKKLIETTKQADKLMMLDIEQKALKLTANSMYGCLGFVYSRFYAKHLASLVTFKGREILTSTRMLVEKLGYEVIYGDTDSLMINTKLSDYNEVIQKGVAIKAEVNRTFRLLEIDIDGVYRPLLLLKKKNYAGMMVKQGPDGQLKSTLETKGIDTVRRDRAVIAREAGEVVLKKLLSENKDLSEIIDNIHSYLQKLSQDIRSNQVDVTKFLISKQLNRNPEEYKDTKALGHIVLALRYNSNPNNTRRFKSGDTIEYVICLDGTSESPNQRAYTLKELHENDNLKLDLEYYLCQQIHPVMVRILGNLSTTNPFILAEMLGVEKSSMIHIPRIETRTSQLDQLASKGVSRFGSCQPLNVRCPKCHCNITISSRTIINKTTKYLEASLTSCVECKFTLSLESMKIRESIIREIKRLTNEFYTGNLVCENVECLYETRNAFCQSNDEADNGQLLCDSCGSIMIQKITDKEHTLQLRYFSYLLDIEEEKELKIGERIDERTIDMYKSCKEEVDYALKCSAVNVYELSSIFTAFSMKPLC